MNRQRGGGGDILPSSGGREPTTAHSCDTVNNSGLTVACPTQVSGIDNCRSLTLTRKNKIGGVRPSCSEPTTRQNSVESSSSSEGGNSSGDSAASAPAIGGGFSWNAASISDLSGSSPTHSSLPSSPCGPKFKLIHEGDIQLCRLNHTRTVISKILSSKFLRRWETHRLYLAASQIYSKTPSGFMEDPVSYSQVEDVYVVARWDASHKFCIRIVISDGSLLLQARPTFQVNNIYLRDQWLHSLLWKRSIFRYQKLLLNSRRSEVLLKELKGLVDMALTTPLQDEGIYQSPLDIISSFLQDQSWIPKNLYEDIISCITPLLERITPSPEICDFFCRHCQDSPRSSIVLDQFTPVVQRILKHNMDFGKYPKTRQFIQDYIQALSSQNEGSKVVQNFVVSIHGPSSTCPHPRVLHNMISICLASFHTLYEEKRTANFSVEVNDSNWEPSSWESRHECFLHLLVAMSDFEDWRPSLAQLLQPIPFPDDALAYEKFTTGFKPILRNISQDKRCDVHLMLLGVRDEKDGWFHLYCPGGIACDDEGDLWSLMLGSMLGCCCRRKRFLQPLSKSLGPCMLRALREDEVCQDALCAMLELDVVDSKDLQLQIITTLQSTSPGKRHYAALCLRQRHLKELQQKGGPRKLTLPSRSTDADVAKLLSCGSFGNLECLSLAFTQVTSLCAEQLIKIPSLRYLNLWSTQFGDPGLQLISEHLPRLQVLNLCETPVTDKGLGSLASMKNLRKLNLNSTSLSAQTFEGLKQKLPALQECDIRYTDAW